MKFVAATDKKRRPTRKPLLFFSRAWAKSVKSVTVTCVVTAVPTPPTSPSSGQGGVRVGQARHGRSFGGVSRCGRGASGRRDQQGDGSSDRHRARLGFPSRQLGACRRVITAMLGASKNKLLW